MKKDHLKFNWWPFVLLVFLLFSACSSTKQKKTNVLKAPSEVGVTPNKEVNPSKMSRVDTNVVQQKPEEASEENKKTAKEAVEPQKPVFDDLPKVNREFRAAWVATVANINWPSRRDLSTVQQKAEAIALLDFLKESNFNAVIFQVRPSADALYESNLEPWSYFLTGQTGRRPSPYYDPLKFWVEEAHKRGLELHVWLNPYRAHHSSAGSVEQASIVRKHPEFIHRLKNGMYWFDPADSRTQDHASKVVLDIVRRYDIDGVHFDDYFYPYASYNGGADFPDYKTWKQYTDGGGKLSRADWRRESVNKFIERIYGEIKREKKHVKFGLSPFGIWKPGYPAGITGSSQYDELYADAKLWLNKGWIDYFAPQLYWPIEPTKQSFTALLSWWESENTHKRHLWPGLNTVGVRSADRAGEISRQIQETRKIIPNSVGAIHWSIAGLTKNPQVASAVRQAYQVDALAPSTPWLNTHTLLAPTLLTTKENGTVYLKWLHKEPDQVFKWVLYYKYDGIWYYEILNANTSFKELPRVKDGEKLEAVAITAVDRLSNESGYDGALISK
ncbi:MAG TPA: family 10 glycosylhydrolase [Candidatus Sphingobacterium stercoripullorum]|uniref:Family 10 glycosylhydrolase n=1 Tax=Candidatus Sphingobacterium stercoripullorum TaxID=2838759 RepID=A0A9D1WCI2_9SPHI|nr:family 10 glycosylhydrolase [Candidatus Sphingobacterium stercoripullorum]